MAILGGMCERVRKALDASSGACEGPWSLAWGKGPGGGDTPGVGPLPNESRTQDPFRDHEPPSFSLCRNRGMKKRQTICLCELRLKNINFLVERGGGGGEVCPSKHWGKKSLLEVNPNHLK